jgi:hypothetical protein
MYAEFAGAVTSLRASAYDRWHRYQARGAYTKLRLLTYAAQVVELADVAIEQATQIEDAGTEQDRAARGEIAKAAPPQMIFDERAPRRGHERPTPLWLPPLSVWTTFRVAVGVRGQLRNAV